MMDIDQDDQGQNENNEAFLLHLSNIEQTTLKKLLKLEQKNKFKKGTVTSSSLKSSANKVN